MIRKEIAVEDVELDKYIKVAKFGVFFLLCALSAGLGSLTFLLLRNVELQSLEHNFNSSSVLITLRVGNSVMRKTFSAKLVNQIYEEAFKRGQAGNPPNITLPNFETTMTALVDVGQFRYVAFAPLVNEITRAGWESYAAENVGLLVGPSLLNTSVQGSWTVEDGIFGIYRNGTRRSDNGYVPSSPFPTILFPIWQIAPIATTYGVVMFNPHSEEIRRVVIDKVIQHKAAYFSDFVHLIHDDFVEAWRPSTIIIGPIENQNNGSLVGIMIGGFYWDVILSGILPSNYGQVDCVIISHNNVLTFALVDARALFVGEGDLHDTRYNRYKQVLEGTEMFDYTLTYYPSDALYRSYITDSPRNMCILVVVLVSFTAALVFYCCHVMHEYNKKLAEAVMHSYAETAAKDAVLESRKIYLRYMAHGMRTPLNIISLGLKSLERYFSRYEAPNFPIRTSTLKEIMRACDVTVVFLNDLLNFSKLVEGQLELKVQRVPVIYFINSAVQSLRGTAEEMGLHYDVNIQSSECTLQKSSFRLESIDETAPLPLKESFQRNLSLVSLNDQDYADVDVKKLREVIRHVISNAVKFSPETGTVSVRVAILAPPAAFPPTLYNPVDTAKGTEVPHTDLKLVPFCASAATAPSDDSNLEAGLYPSLLLNPKPKPKKHDEDSVDYGTVVIEVTDSGPGMTPEQSSKLFCDVAHFDPTDLKPGSGSGLGSVIAKALVQMHHGEIDIVSKLTGCGCVCTVKIPISPPPDMLPQSSVSYMRTKTPS